MSFENLLKLKMISNDISHIFLSEKFKKAFLREKQRKKIIRPHINTIENKIVFTERLPILYKSESGKLIFIFKR